MTQSGWKRPGKLWHRCLARRGCMSSIKVRIAARQHRPYHRATACPVRGLRPHSLDDVEKSTTRWRPERDGRNHPGLTLTAQYGLRKPRRHVQERHCFSSAEVSVYGHIWSYNKASLSYT